MKKLILVFLLLLVKSKGEDCVPLTFEQLSILIHHPVDYDIWHKELIINKHPPDLDKCIQVWNKHFPRNPLVCIWAAPDIKLNDPPIIIYDAPIKFKSLKNPIPTPYLLVCNEFKELRADMNEEANCHCSICYFNQNGVTIINTLKPQKIDKEAIYVQEINYETFWKMVLLVFQINVN